MKQLPILVNYRYKNGRTGSCFLGKFGLYDNEEKEDDYGGEFEIDLVNEARLWIREYMKKVEHIIYINSSYGLKHICEPFMSEHYIANGEFIYAMVLEGFNIVRGSVGSPNCFFNAKKLKGIDLKSKNLLYQSLHE